MAKPLRSMTTVACRASAIQAGIILSRPKNSLSICRQSIPSLQQLHQSSFNVRSSFQTTRRCLSTFGNKPSGAKFTYGIAASFTAKDHKYNFEKNVFAFNPYNRIIARRKDKSTRPDSGQDAFFVAQIKDTHDVALGIADGVGGWADSGVDPADFSHGFCDYMAHAAYIHSSLKENPSLNARSLMQRGYDDICKDPSVDAGGSTACVGIVKGDGTLEVANLGDSGFVQLRRNAIHEYSEPQTHAFNTPYQLAIIPDKVLKQAAAFGGQQLCDLPKDANVTQHSLRHGDVLIFASDGVWDNLSHQDILKVVSKIMLGSKAWEHTNEGVSVATGLGNYLVENEKSSVAEDIPTLQNWLAVGITGEAKVASMNTRRDGPFAREVQKYYPHENWRGGKVDDICVVVAVVCEEGK